MEPELSGIFWIKMVAKNIVFEYLGTNFVHMRVKQNDKNLTSGTPGVVCLVLFVNFALIFIKITLDISIFMKVKNFTGTGIWVIIFFRNAIALFIVLCWSFCNTTKYEIWRGCWWNYYGKKIP